ncbi:MAG: class IV adenylate cyclase [Bryobacteraceae bacterium]|jgi:adenylate cyclase class 2
MSRGSQENEIKLAVADLAAVRGLLRQVGFRLAHRRVFEANTVFDTARLTLRRGCRLLRLRQAGRVVTLTFKGRPLPGPHKNREELEIRLPDAARFAEILARLGYQAVFRYEKYRTEFRMEGETGMAMLDETPIGVYLELEGPPAWIDRTARRMGFGMSDYITASYARLYLDWRKQQGLKPGDMVF